MASVFTLQPTFTQGFILGQLSILILLALILKYLFLDSVTEPGTPYTIASVPIGRPSNKEQSEKQSLDQDSSVETLPVLPEGSESTEWFNLIIHEVGHKELSHSPVILTFSLDF